MEKTDVLVVGGGQAGIALSEHLTNFGIPHIVLERDRIAESWRTRRWDSLVANGPAWHDRFPGLEFSEYQPDDFVAKDHVAAYLEKYAAKFDVPIRTGIAAKELRRNVGKPGFTVDTSAGTSIEANYVVAATGAFQVPVIPNIIPSTAGLHQIHSADYRNPAQLPQGGVLVVGAGSSGAQIAEELARSGRKTFLSVGPHDRPPRAYRGRDFVWWLGVLNKWDAETSPGAEHTTIAVSGAGGGHTIDFRRMALEDGVTLVGRTANMLSETILTFTPDLNANLTRGDQNYLSVLQEADAYIERNGLDLPEEKQAHEIPADPECVKAPILELDLSKEGISTVIWATGFRNDYSWMKVNAVDANGNPQHKRGISEEPGVYFLGLPWQTRRGSSFIWGVWHDARFVCEHISKQRGYMAYQPKRI